MALVVRGGIVLIVVVLVIVIMSVVIARCRVSILRVSIITRILLVTIGVLPILARRLSSLWRVHWLLASHLRIHLGWLGIRLERTLGANLGLLLLLEAFLLLFENALGYIVLVIFIRCGSILGNWLKSHISGWNAKVSWGVILALDLRDLVTYIEVKGHGLVGSNNFARNVLNSIEGMGVSLVSTVARVLLIIGAVDLSGVLVKASESRFSLNS